MRISKETFGTLTQDLPYGLRGGVMWAASAHKKNICVNVARGPLAFALEHCSLIDLNSSFVDGLSGGSGETSPCCSVPVAGLGVQIAHRRQTGFS